MQLLTSRKRPDHTYPLWIYIIARRSLALEVFFPPSSSEVIIHLYDLCATGSTGKTFVTWIRSQKTWIPSISLEIYPVFFCRFFFFLEKEFFILVENFPEKRKTKFWKILMLFNRVFIFTLQFDWKNGFEKLKFKKWLSPEKRKTQKTQKRNTGIQSIQAPVNIYTCKSHLLHRLFYRDYCL